MLVALTATSFDPALPGVPFALYSTKAHPISFLAFQLEDNTKLVVVVHCVGTHLQRTLSARDLAISPQHDSCVAQIRRVNLVNLNFSPHVV